MIDMNDPEVIESLKYLLVPKEERIRASAMPFDGKKNVFVPEKTEAFIKATIESEDEKKGTVTCVTEKGDKVVVKKGDIEQMNPPKYEKCDDMADLTYLNDATVLHNLRQRYMSWYIYTYSGLFCVAINPYKRLPVYTMKMVHYYRGKKKNEVPPHLYLVSDNAYSCMTRDKENQSMLITGESGAGKTENTKKVIQYFAFVASSLNPKKQSAEDANKPSLEDQIISANPVLEAYGNAKTTRNNNSSRFGKFIRIHFSAQYAIAGADIESYLLEKSRITYCMERERNYHIFYQLCSPAFPEIQKKCLIEADVSKYFFANQGMLTIDGVDDCQEMRDTKKAFDILNFTEEQQIELFKCTATVLIWGNQGWKQRPREEQAEADGTDEIDQVAQLLGLDAADLLKGLTKPKIKVGNDYVNKGQNKDQCANSVQALSKAIYSRCFHWLVEIVNLTLDVKTVKRAHFIGVLDIAGFETFEYNGFEQLCINFTNEKLQQFFNHFMFVLEQEEYQKEGIVWEMMNFGMDLQACIDLIEKPLGIFSILEEECIVPKGTDMTFKDKLYSNHNGKHACFGKPKPKKGKPDAHFDINHYAGIVSYSVDGWLEKNKDPINMTVAMLFKNSTGNKLLSYLFRDIEEVGAAGKKGKGITTISAGHREQLNKLMSTLRATHPHFVRCIIPNEIKTGGVLDAHLVLHQLHCNGVLEGIRICRKGYPSRIMYAEFVQRYSILAASACKQHENDPKKATQAIVEEVKLDTELYRIGHTKILFKAGVLGTLEDYRDTAISKILVMLQGQMRRYLTKKHYKRMLDQRLALSVVQRNAKAYITLRTWGWWKLFSNVKPLLQFAKKEEERLAREAEEARLKELERIENERRAALAKELEEANVKLLKEKNDLFQELSQLRDVLNNSEQQVNKLNMQKSDLESQITDLEDKLASEESSNNDLMRKKKNLEAELNESRRAIDETVSKVKKTESDVKSRENQIHKLQDELASLDEQLAKLNKDKKRLEDLNNRTIDSLQQEEDKVKHLNKVKSKLEQALDESEEMIEREKREKSDLEKSKRKLESELKSSLASIDDMERIKRDVDDVVKQKISEINNLSAKLEDEHNHFISEQKKVKDLQMQLAEAEEETQSERAARSKAEKQRAELARELDDVSDRLEEAGGATTAQLDLNKKREMELNKLRRDLEDANIQHEATATQLRKKHQDAVNEMGQQIEQLQKAKNRLEKEKQQSKSELEESRLQTESIGKAKQNVEKMVNQLEQQIQEMNSKTDDVNRQLNDMTFQKNKLQSENANLLTQLEDSEGQVGTIARLKQQFNVQLEDARREAEDESRAKSSLMQQLRNLNMDLDSYKNQLDDEQALRIESQKSLAKANTECQQWRSKYETEGLVRAEELEEAKRKLASKLADAEDQVEQAIAKCAGLEKAKQRLQSEIEDLSVDVEKANSNASAMEKKQKQFDRLINDWKQKCEGITLELENSQKEARQYSTEVFKLKSQYEESQDSIEAITRENKNLADEIKDLIEQLSSGGKSVHELEKSMKRVVLEKEELQVALEDAESTLEQEESKVSLAQLELANVRQEIDRRLHEKEEEFESTRRNHVRALESMQASLDAESKGKADVIKQKKKLETDINELEISLDHTNRNVADLQKNNQKLNQTIMEQLSQIDDEQRLYAELKEVANASDRRCNTLMGECDEIRAALELAERARVMCENELHDAADRMGELSSSNANLNAQKRKLESEIIGMQMDLDEAVNELKNSEDRLKKSTNDAARLAEELRQEQEHSHNAEKARKNLEIQLKEIQNRLDTAEANAIKNGKRFIQKLEGRIHELENELEVEQRHHQETLKEVKKNDRRLKDLMFQSEEEKRSQFRLTDLVEKLQNKIKANKRLIEETEEIAAMNLAKFRKAQHELDDALERADQAENQLNKLRAKNRSGTSVGRGSPQRDPQSIRAASVAQMRAGSVRR